MLLLYNCVQHISELLKGGGLPLSLRTYFEAMKRNPTKIRHPPIPVITKHDSKLTTVPKIKKPLNHYQKYKRKFAL